MSWKEKWGSDFNELTALELINDYSNAPDRDLFIKNLMTELNDRPPNFKGENTAVDKHIKKLQGEKMPEHNNDCPEGQIYDKETGKCIELQDEKKCPEGQVFDKDAGKCVEKKEVPAIPKQKEEQQAKITGAPNPEGDKTPTLGKPKEGETTSDPLKQCKDELIAQGQSPADATALCGERAQKQVSDNAPTPSAGKEAEPAGAGQKLEKEINDYRNALRAEIKDIDKEICSDVLNELEIAELVALRNSLGRVVKMRQGKRKSFAALSATPEGKKKLNTMLGLPNEFEVVIDE